MENFNFLIEPEELKALIAQPVEKIANIRVIDGTLFPPLDKRNPKEYFAKKRIPYSQFFDVNGIATPGPIPHTMPDNKIFISHMKELDIRKSDTVIIYDRCGMFSSPRVWYTFYLFGHRNVKVLNGGLPYYEKEKGEFEEGDDYRVKKQNEIRKNIPASDSDFSYDLEKGKVLSIEEVIKNKEDEIIDARNEERYKGEVDEPRKSLRVGHIKGAKSLFFKRLLDSNNRYKTKEEIMSVLSETNLDLNKKVIAYCGTGLTACIDILGLALVGKVSQCKLYDGSWMEIGNKSEEEIAKIQNEH